MTIQLLGVAPFQETSIYTVYIPRAPQTCPMQLLPPDPRGRPLRTFNAFAAAPTLRVGAAPKWPAAGPKPLRTLEAPVDPVV